MIQAPATVDDSWKCPKCGRQKGDFILLGNGLIQCKGCGTKVNIEKLVQETNIEKAI